MTDSKRPCGIYRLCDGVWAGRYPDEPAIRQLTSEGVTTYVDLTRWDEQWVYSIKDYGKLLPEGARRFRFPLWTYWLPPIENLLAIVKMVEDNAPTYVHCRQGLDRTGVIAALVLRKRGMELNEALSYLTLARGTTSPRKRYHLKYLKKAVLTLVDELSGHNQIPQK